MLPSITVPKYSTTLPVKKVDVEFRPFLVKEEKVMLIALQENNQKSTFSAIRDMMRECTYGLIDISKLSQVDAEWLFLQVRNKSMGETVDVNVRCPHCEAKTLAELNLDNVKVESTVGEIKTSLELTPTCKVTMRFPSMETYYVSDGNQIRTVAECLETLYIDGVLYDANDIKLEEKMKWVEELPKPQAAMIEEFFDQLPRLVYTDQVTCIKCLKPIHIRLEGMEDFFA